MFFYFFKKSFLNVVWALFFASAASVAAEAQMASRPVSPETVLLEARLKEIVQNQEQVEQKLKREARLAVPPYREYLLLQKSLHFADLFAAQNRLESEGERVAQQLVSRPEPFDASVIEAFNRPRPAALPPFSGAPSLSFIEASRVDEEPVYSPARAFFVRLALYAALLVIVMVPTAAVVQTFRQMFRRRRKLAPVIEISSFRKKGPDQEMPWRKAA